jgi:hypothetical protein
MKKTYSKPTLVRVQRLSEITAQTACVLSPVSLCDTAS